MPSGLRVNWTALASARYSRCRDTAAMISRPKNAPTKPSTNTPTPSMTMPPRELSLPDRRPPDVNMRVRPMMDNAMIPKIRPISRMLSRMSPFRMWLNSWATTPCSSSRVKYLRQPWETATTASPGHSRPRRH